MSKSSVVINYISGKYFVWNPDDVFLLRTKHRVCGQLVGSIPRKPWQPSVHSLPLILLPAEAHFCYKNGFGEIVIGRDYFSKRIDDPSNIEAFEHKRFTIECEQIRNFKTEKGEKEKVYFGFSKKLSRRAKRHLRETEIDSQSESETMDSNTEMKCQDFDPLSKKVKCGTSNSDLSNDEHGSMLKCDPAFNPSDETSACKECPDDETTLDIHSEHNHTSPADISKDADVAIQWDGSSLTEEDFTYYNHALRVHIPTSATSGHSFDTFLSNYSMTEKEKCSCFVYEDIHKRGLFITSALKFGGDFLVYLGDPLRHHSHYIIVVMERNEIISTKELVTYGRMAAAVKKTVVLATLDHNFSGVSYLSITWAQMK